MKESGEFAWDEATGTPTANNEIWDRYVEASTSIPFFIPRWPS
jgi:hypothetical protein